MFLCLKTNHCSEKKHAFKNQKDIFSYGQENKRIVKRKRKQKIMDTQTDKVCYISIRIKAVLKNIKLKKEIIT